MSTMERKRKLKENQSKAIDLFVDAPPDASSDDLDDDESDESVYSGLEDEPDTSSEEEDEEDDVMEGSSDEGEDSSESDREGLVSMESDVSKQAQQTRPKTRKVTRKITTEDNAEQMKAAAVNGKHKQDASVDEYHEDSSDEEDIRNTIGNVPVEWYKEFDHIGYDILGKKIIKPKQGDQLDDFLNKMDNPDYWRTVKDRSTGQDVILSDKDAELVKSYRAAHYSDPNHDPHAPWVDFFTNEVMIHPLKNTPAHKRSFIPSLWEKKKVGQYVHAIKMGWMKPRKPKTDEEEEEEQSFYELWSATDESETNKRISHHIPAPKLTLPGHAESYNPPPEYLLTEEEELVWKNKEEGERRINFLPQKHSSLRLVPAYNRFMNERFERSLDLYLCPRQRKLRMNVEPQDLIPKVPKPRDLQPFPTTQSVVYTGHTDLVRCISVDPSGQWLASGSDDGSLRLWEVSTGRCMRTLEMGGVVKAMVWNPNTNMSLVAAAIENDVVIVNPGLGDKLVISNTDKGISAYVAPNQEDDTSRKLSVEWSQYSGAKWDQGFRLKITHIKPVTQLSWHGVGDYLVSVSSASESQAVIIHQVSKRRSQLPFTKAKGLVQCVHFHPTRPFLFVATQRYVRVYNLLKQELVKKLMTNCKWVSSLAVHPGGDNVIIGSYDSRLSWFDLDLSTKPYQTLRHQKKAIRQVCYHKRYPLFASCSDDGTVVVCHGMVYNDLLQNPLIVPVKILRGHTPNKELGVLDCVFHPTQPWIFSSGADHTIRLYS